MSVSAFHYSIRLNDQRLPSGYELLGLLLGVKLHASFYPQQPGKQRFQEAVKILSF